MAAIQWTDVEARLQWEAMREEYVRIREVWLKHCDTELKQDLDGLLSTLTNDCVYIVLRTTAAETTSQRWEGQRAGVLPGPVSGLSGSELEARGGRHRAAGRLQRRRPERPPGRPVGRHCPDRQERLHPHV